MLQRTWEKSSKHFTVKAYWNEVKDAKEEEWYVLAEKLCAEVLEAKQYELFLEIQKIEDRLGYIPQTSGEFEFIEGFRSSNKKLTHELKKVLNIKLRSILDEYEIIDEYEHIGVLVADMVDKYSIGEKDFIVEYEVQFEDEVFRFANEKLLVGEVLISAAYKTIRKKIAGAIFSISDEDEKYLKKVFLLE